ncbi:MAG: phosphoglucomutase/phosphomannomutase family protein [Anaerolineae bacterium]
MIHFGTDGWRAVISEEFTFENLRKVTQAVADWAREEQAKDDMVFVVGFDTRFLSDRYAMEVARVLASNGIRVLLSKADTPTPVISQAIVQHGADGGVMITASHNPPRYNGFKLKAAYGGAASPDVCRQVEARLADNEARNRPVALEDVSALVAEGRIQRFDPMPGYREHLKRIVDFDALRSARLRVMVDPMYGAGRLVLAQMLADLGMEVVEIHNELNPGFGGLHPEPIARYLGDLIRQVPAGGFDLGVATDGDADRIGAVAADGRFLSPHAILSLLLWYLVERRGLSGAVVKTVSTTRMLDRQARHYGLPLFETPVGFNHIADLMLTNDVLLGGEESGGISVRGHVPEGDGILVALLLVEMVAREGRPLGDLWDDLQRRFGPFFYARHDARIEVFDGGRYDKQGLIERLTQSPPASLGGLDVVGVSAKDGVKYALADDSWLLIRPSGTEPVLRIYAEATSEELVGRLLEEGQRLGLGVVAAA